jgi:integrase
MRIGEALGLQWGDIDFAGRFAEVQRTFTCGRVTTPKGNKKRRVDLSLQLTETLQTLLVERKKETLRRGWREVPPWIFVNSVGTPLNYSILRLHVWVPLLAKAGLRHIRIHDLRHTFASFLIQNGESLAYIKEQLGHASIKMTVDVYGHLMPSGNRAAVDRLDDVQPALAATIRNFSATADQEPVRKKG